MRQHLEDLVRAGKFKDASALLQKVRVSKLDRSDALAYASLASRMGQLQVGLKILNPIVRGENLSHPADDPEKIQYANLLRKLGAISESFEILNEIDPERNPEVSLNLAFCHSTQWEYDKAIPYLRMYLNNMTDNPYKAAVAKVNLLAALIHEDEFSESRDLIKELHEVLDQQQSALLIGNIYELSAQLEIKMKNWPAAVSCLKQASGLLQSAKESPAFLYIEKWIAVVEALQNNQVSASLLSVREKALSLREWETFRDCEFYIAKISQNEETLIRMYFGTPYESYRKRIVQAFGNLNKIPDSFLWSQRRENSPGETFDLTTARFEKADLALPPGQSLHRLLILLSQDFYKPVPLISLYAKLFPGEYFNPVSSPNRTHQVIKRLRKVLSENEIPLTVDETSGGYRLQFQSNFSVRIPRDSIPTQADQLEILRLKKMIPQSEFSAREVARVLSLSRSETQRLLKSAIDAGELERIGCTNKTIYRKIA